jgi:hypothetical protein
VVEANNADGVGFVLKDTPYAAFDLDDCFIKVAECENEPAPWAKKLVESAGSYWELTPSGGGLRIIGTAEGDHVDTGKLSMPVGSLEIYRKATRYITITGVGEGELTNIDALIDAMKPQREQRVAQQVAVKAAKFKDNQAEEDRVKSALKAIPADAREIWLKVGAALHGTGWDNAESLWRDRSLTCPAKFDERDQKKTWIKFGQYAGEKATLASIFSLRILGRVYNQNGIMRMLTAYIIAAKQVSVFS